MIESKRFFEMLWIIVFLISGSLLYGQPKGALQGDFNNDGVVDDFEKDILKRNINPGNTSTQNSAPISREPAFIQVDFSKERGEFSKYLFMTVDSFVGEEAGFQLAREGNFRIYGIVHFLTGFSDPGRKLDLLAKYDIEGFAFFGIEMESPQTNEKVREYANRLIDIFEKAKKKNPSLKLGAVLFGNEPDIPVKVPYRDGTTRSPHWNGTQQQFFENYSAFVVQIKKRDKNILVGTPGFAPDTFFSKKNPQTMPEAMFKYLYEHDVPVDFISFHSYSTEIKTSFSAQLKKIKNLLSKYPVISPAFGTPKIANSEFDFAGCPPDSPYRPEFDSTWRASHNIIAISAMLEQGLWLACSDAGPWSFIPPRRDVSKAENEVNFSWVRSDGTVKPIFYAWKAFNDFSGKIQIETGGSNFETFSAIAGKSKSNDSLSILLSSYDQYSFLKQFPGNEGGTNWQTEGVPVFEKYKIAIQNSPWQNSDKLKIETWAVNDTQRLQLISTQKIAGGKNLIIEDKIGLPEVKLIKISPR
jgi:hypothetical protein